MDVTFYPHKKLRKNGLRDASGLKSEKPMKRLPFLPPSASRSVLHAFQVFFLLVLPQRDAFHWTCAKSTSLLLSIISIWEKSFSRTLKRAKQALTRTRCSRKALDHILLCQIIVNKFQLNTIQSENS